MRAPLAVACLLAVAVAVADAARAATPPGAPHIGAPRAADDHAHPGARREWWRIEAHDPRGRGSAIVEVVRERGATLSFHFYDDGMQSATSAHPLDSLRVGRGTLDATGPHVAVHIRRRADRVVAQLTLPASRSRIALAGAWRGPAARNFDLGREWSRDPGTGHPRLWLSWTQPVARAATKARFVHAGRVLADARGWLGSYEHGWGDIDLGDPDWNHWDEHVVHLPSATWVLFGLNRTETNTGPGARDAMWLGVLARVTRGGIRACRAHIRRPRWHDRFGMFWPLEAHARCGRLRATFREASVLGVDLVDHKLARAVTTVGGRGVGWSWHAFH